MPATVMAGLVFIVTLDPQRQARRKNRVCPVFFCIQSPSGRSQADLKTRKEEQQ
jgi:hypothetical protein